MDVATHDEFEVESNAAALAAFPVEEPTKPEEPEETAAAEAPEPQAAAEPAKIDKRTKEGRKASIQAEIDELTARKYDTKRELESAQSELAKLRAERDKLSTPVQSAPVKAAVDPNDPEPDPAKYDGGEYDPKYLRAVGAWEARQEIRASEQKRAQQEAAHAFNQAVTRVTEAGRKAHTDYDAVLASADRAGLTFPPAVIDAIFTESFGHELAYDLAAHPDDLRRLASLPAPVAAREVGKRLVRLEAAHSGPAPTAPVTSTAQAPIKPVDASPVAVEKDEYSEDESIESFVKRENAALRKRRQLPGV